MRLSARLLDICLRSVKIEIDRGDHDIEVSSRSAGRDTPRAATVTPSPPLAERGSPRLHPD